MILVTGGAGYIGSHTVVDLINNGYDVLVVDNFCNSTVSVIADMEKICGKTILFENINLIDKEAVLALAAKYKFTSVIHFAAYKAVKESSDNPMKYYENNIVGLMNVIQLMQKSGCKNLIFSSSCTVYGEVDKVPVKESSPIQQPLSPYGNTKKICEEIIRDMTSIGAIEAIALRYFNPIGAHTTYLLGDNPQNFDNIMPLIIKVAKGISSHLNVFGDDYNTVDGSCVRDYVHVMDIASAHVKAMERMRKGKMEKAFEAFNLGSEKGYSVFELIKTFEKVNNVKVNFKVVGRREGDVSNIYSDSTLAKEKLEWKINFSIEEMLSSAWKRSLKQT